MAKINHGEDVYTFDISKVNGKIKREIQNVAFSTISEGEENKTNVMLGNINFYGVLNRVKNLKKNDTEIKLNAEWLDEADGDLYDALVLALATFDKQSKKKLND